MILWIVNFFVVDNEIERLMIPAYKEYIQNVTEHLLECAKEYSCLFFYFWATFVFVKMTIVTTILFLYLLYYRIALVEFEQKLKTKFWTNDLK